MTPISCADQEGHDGVAKDYAEAMRWYKRAADLGGADGMHDVGWPMNTDRAEIIGGSTVNGSPGLHRTCDQPLCAPCDPLGSPHSARLAAIGPDGGPTRSIDLWRAHVPDGPRRGPANGERWDALRPARTRMGPVKVQ